MMLKILSLLAAADANPLTPSPPPVLEGGKETYNLLTSQMRDVFLICGAALVVGLVLFLWAYLTRKDRQTANAMARGSRILTRPERRSSQRHSEGHSEHQGRRVRIRKRRREHADNFGRNPTLAEAGGLPPLRPEEPEPPPETIPPQPQSPTPAS